VSLSSVSGTFAGRARGVLWPPARLVALALAIVAAAAIAAGPAARPAGAQAAAVSTPPSPTRFVTDDAGFLSASAHAELEQRLERYERDTGHQVLLWIGQTTGGEAIEPWAVRAFAAWKVGRKGLDDGVAVFIMAADRRLRIEVGYGLEDRVPDAVASRIIGDQMIPRLRAGDRDGAARAGVSGVLAAVGGEQGAPPEPIPLRDARPELSKAQLIVFGILAILVLGFLVTHPTLALLLLQTIAANSGRGGGFSGGGGRSGGGGASGSW